MGDCAARALSFVLTAAGSVGDSQWVQVYAFRQVSPAGRQTDVVQFNLDALDEADRTAPGDVLPVATRHMVGGVTVTPGSRSSRSTLRVRR